jgi:hypothetical protein
MRRRSTNRRRDSGRNTTQEREPKKGAPVESPGRRSIPQPHASRLEAPPGAWPARWGLPATGSHKDCPQLARKSDGQALSLDEAKAAFRAEYEARKGTKKNGAG